MACNLCFQAFQAILSNTIFLKIARERKKQILFVNKKLKAVLKKFMESKKTSERASYLVLTRYLKTSSKSGCRVEMSLI